MGEDHHGIHVLTHSRDCDPAFLHKEESDGNQSHPDRHSYDVHFFGRCTADNDNIIGGDSCRDLFVESGYAGTHDMGHHTDTVGDKSGMRDDIDVSSQAHQCHDGRGQFLISSLLPRELLASQVLILKIS